jgi:hypothetical protein
MRKVLGRAARLLMAAGALGLARPAAAQGPQAEAPAAAAEPAAVLPAEQARLEELRVSLAWLTDPTTFPHALRARVVGDSLEAGGTVPDEATKQQALKLARQHTALPVLDAVEVLPGKPVKRVALPAGAVQREAAAFLGVALGARGRGLTVQARADGQVTVRGAVGSMEEKLFVSQRLRQVTGCTSVVNRLTVAPVADAPAPATARGPAGSLQEKLFVSQQLREAGGQSAPRPPVEEPKAPAPAERPAVATTRVVSVAPAPPAPASYASQLSRLAPSLSAPDADLHLPGKGNAAAAEKGTAADLPKAPPPAVAVEKAEAPAPRSAPPRPVAPPVAAPTPATRASYVATEPQATPGPVPANAPRPPAVVPARLRQRVQAAAGARALAVQVLTGPDQSVTVRVRVASYDDQAQLASRILQLPEMRAANVQLEFQVAP